MVVRVEDSWDLSSRIFHYAIRQRSPAQRCPAPLRLSPVPPPPRHGPASAVNRIRKSANLIKARQVSVPFLSENTFAALFQIGFQGFDFSKIEEGVAKKILPIKMI